MAVCYPELDRVRPVIVRSSTAPPAQILSMIMPNRFARWPIPGETGSQCVQLAGVFWRGLVHDASIGQRSRVDQPTTRGRTSANLGYSKPLFACVHGILAIDSLRPARAIFFLTFTAASSNDGVQRQHLGRFAEAEIVAPTPHIRGQLFHRRLDAHALGPARDLPDSPLEPFQRFWRDRALDVRAW